VTSFRSLALVSLVGLVVVGCSKESSPPPTSPTPAAPTVTGVTVTGYNGTPMNRRSQTMQLAASARYSDGSTRDVSATAAWRSDNPGVAEVSPGGLVTARGDGEATIAADVQGVAGNQRLRVALPRRAEPQVTGTIDVRPSPEPIFLFRAEMTLTFRELSQAVGMNVNFVNVTWRDYDNKLLIFRNYNPGDLAQIWGNNHIAAATSRGIVARIDYSRPLSRVSVLVETSVQDDFGNIINFSETFRDSVGVRPTVPVSLVDLHRPAVLWGERGLEP
jgi:hypothetical protein